MSRSLRFALIGENVQYSQSPHIFEAVFRQIGQAGDFDLHSVSAAGLGECLKLMISDAVSGFSVTIPHKQGIIKYLDQLDPVATSLNAVNSVRIGDDEAILGLAKDHIEPGHGDQPRFNDVAQDIARADRGQLIGITDQQEVGVGIDGPQQAVG